VEVLPFDELPVGAPDTRPPVTSAKAVRLRAELAAARADMAQASRRDQGHVDATSGRLMGRIGGLARALSQELARLEAERAAARAELAATLLPGLVVTDPDFKAGLLLAEEFIATQLGELAKHVGGGECPNGPSSMVVSAALQLLASRVLFARGDFARASALANDSRQNLAAAHEYVVKLQTALEKDPTAARSRWLVPANGAPGG
jgi:hypothetical protein